MPGHQWGFLSQVNLSTKVMDRNLRGGQGRLAHPSNSPWVLHSQGSPLVLLTLCLCRYLAITTGAHPVSNSLHSFWGPCCYLQRAAGSEAGGMLRLLSCIWAQPLPGSRKLGVGNLGSKRGCEVAAPLIRRGGKEPILWHYEVWVP